MIDSDDHQLFRIKVLLESVPTVIRVHKLLENIDNEIIRKRFENSIQDKIEQMTKVIIEFVKKANVKNKQILSQTCNDTNAMNDVLTSLHNEIVNGGNGTFNQLLDGGVSLYNFVKK